MERKVPFVEGENYHVYTRGVEKRTIFLENRDYDRFMLLLLLCNSKKPVHVANTLKKYQGEPLIKWLEGESKPEEGRLTAIMGYALMPNHIHLALRESTEGGISKFMLKLMTAYSMYFNTKHQRSGPLFARPFRSKHADSDEYMRWLFSYIHLNPLDLLQPGWREHGIAEKERAATFIQTYKYSSFNDYCSGTRQESKLLSKDALPIPPAEIASVDTLFDIFHARTPDEQENVAIL